jgi:hypothetical protein
VNPRKHSLIKEAGVGPVLAAALAEPVAPSIGIFPGFRLFFGRVVIEPSI